MARRLRHRAPAVVLAACAAFVAGGCGTAGITVPQDSTYYEGAVLFKERCGGCHTFKAAGSTGGSQNVRDLERTDGPNLDGRPEEVDQVLYAIRNGGFSGAIMPQNIVTGEDAQKVAEFVARYAGSEAGQQGAGGSAPSPGQ